MGREDKKVDIHSLKRILRFTAATLTVTSLFFTFPVIGGVYYGESVENAALFVAVLFITSFLVFSLFAEEKPRLDIKEAIFAVNLIWLSVSLAGGALLYIITQIPFYDAFFEAVSGFTTTGATIYEDIEALPKSALIARSLMHWLGGMGIVVLAVGLLSLINPAGSLTLFKSESTGINLEKPTPKIKETAIRLWIIYIALTVFDLLALKLAGMPFFDALNHAFSTVSTGGFSTKNASLGAWGENSAVIWITTVFMILAGTNFIAHLRLLSGDWRGYASVEVRWYLGIFILLSTALWLIRPQTAEDDALARSFFAVASILTTTGFVIEDYEQLGHVTVALIFTAMLIGGCAGSTSGGVKVIRYLVLFKNLSLQIRQTLHPLAHISLSIDKKRISQNILSKVSGFFFIYAITTAVLGLFLYGNGHDFLTSVSAAVATVGNIGPGFSMAGPTESFYIFSPAEKVVLAIFMIVGRLEFYTIFALFSKELYKRF